MGVDLATYLEQFLVDVLKPSLLHGFVLDSVLDHGKRPAHLSATFNKDLAPLTHRTIWLNRAIVTLNDA